MKKLIALLLLSVFLLSSTELKQLAKLPVLIDHFNEHKAEDQSITFWEFLSIHYAGKTVYDSDYETDMKLPFKSHDGCAGTYVLGLVSNNFTFFNKLVFHAVNEFGIYNESFNSSTYLSCIWQPPKFC